MAQKRDEIDWSEKMIVSQLGFSVIGVILSAFSLSSIVPETVQNLSVATNIEMMKDFEIVRSVVRDQKLDKAERGVRILSVLRAIRENYVRQLVSEQIPNNRQRIEELINGKISEVTESKKHRKIMSGSTQSSMDSSMMDESQLVNRLEDDMISEIGPALEKLDSAEKERQTNPVDESLMFEQSEMGEPDAHNLHQTMSLSPNREQMGAPRPVRSKHQAYLDRSMASSAQ